MTQGTSRRRFLQQSAALPAVWWLGAPLSARPRSANERLDLGIIGVANRGSANLNAVAHENIVALCDVDRNYLAAAGERFPQAKRYTDFREMIATESLDGVVISTPDHTHAVATIAALQAGLHVYCEKPLTHTVAEARQVTELARAKGKITQMGTQIHAGDNYRRVVERVRSGVLGPIEEVHVWVGKNWGGGSRPAERPAPPEHLDWDLWLGPAAWRPYHPRYVPANWRRWWDFGGGTLADMACHHMDLPFWALDLRRPTRVEAFGPPIHAETAPQSLTIEWIFPTVQQGQAVDVKLRWYDGGPRPPHFESVGLPQWGDGTLFVGREGLMLADYGRHLLLPEERFRDVPTPEPTIPDSIGHHREWLEACRGNGQPLCSFDYAGALTETVLLGTVAYRCGYPLQWEAETMQIPNAPEAESWLRSAAREGWDFSS